MPSLPMRAERNNLKKTPRSFAISENAVIAAAPFINMPVLLFIPTISVFVLILCEARPKYEKEQFDQTAPL